MSVANAYAKALFQTVQAKNATAQDLDTLETQLAAFVSAVESSREAKMALYGPIANTREKIAIVQKLGQAMGVTGTLPNFLELLAKKDRLAILPQVRDSFHTVRLASEGGILGEVISAEPMDQKDVDSLAQSFSKKLGKRVAFKVSVDAALLAGMKVVVSGVTYDGTLQSQLQKLRDQVAAGATAGPLA
jgi:F-type H+-transporting ATPase subunit delta